MKSIFKIGVVALLGGGAYYLYRQYKLLQQFDYKIVGVSVPKFTKSSAVMGFTFKFDNKSDVGFEILGYDLEVFIGGKKVGEAKSDIQRTIGAKSKSTVSFDISFNPSSVATGGVSALLTGVKPTVTTKGFIIVKPAGLNLVRKIPVDYDYKM